MVDSNNHYVINLGIMDMNKYLITAAMTGLLLTGCGGSSSDSNNVVVPEPDSLIGQFIDSNVSGVDFKTATQSGTTNSKGEFSFVSGESVTFSIGELVFPSVTADEIVTPLDLAGTEDVSSPEVLNMVSLLMTLDTDANPNNGIFISTTAKDAATPLNFDMPTDEFAVSPAVLNLISNAGQDIPVTTLVDAKVAQEHMQNSLDNITNLTTYADFTGMFNLEADSHERNYTGIYNIYPNGSYLMIEYYSDDDESGFEYGSLGLKDGELNPIIDIDTNGAGGLSNRTMKDVYMDADVYHMTITEKNCTDYPCTYKVTTPKSILSTTSIAGSWETQDGSASYNFRDDGKYFFAQITDANENIGIEVGNYNFDADSDTLTLDLTQGSDSSGSTLLANDGVSYTLSSAIISKDAQILTLMVDYNNGKDTQLVLNRKM